MIYSPSFPRSMALVLLLALGSSPFRPLMAQDDFCGIRNISFQSGERLKYKVYYNMGPLWVGAGIAEFSVEKKKMNQRPVFHIKGVGTTLKSYEWFFKVYDVYESYVDVETLLPHRFIRNVNEGGFRIYNDVRFQHSIGQAISTNGVFKVPHCVQDVLSAIYYARNIDFDQYSPGDQIPFDMFLDDQVYSLYVRYLGKEELKTRYGRFNTIKFSPLLIEGTIFEGGEKMTVWVTDDQNHLPVRVDSPILVGSIKVDLIEFQNIRHPLRSLIRKK